MLPRAARSGSSRRRRHQLHIERCEANQSPDRRAASTLTACRRYAYILPFTDCDCHTVFMLMTSTVSVTVLRIGHQLVT